jgi:type II restriction enzyme
LDFDRSLAEGYQSAAQRARRLTEGWFANQMYCPACGEQALRQHPNNARDGDFSCASCGADFELKGARRPLGTTIPDGAFGAMMERLERQGGGPHLAILHYCTTRLSVRDLVVVASPFLTKDMILQRPPLGPNARRAGWVGCNIRIADVPSAGRIAVVQNGQPMPKAGVIEGVRRAATVGGTIVARTWLVETLRCVERLGPEFDLSELYACEAELRSRYPDNQNIRPKVRQQLQRLRDAGLLVFLGQGRYRRVAVDPSQALTPGAAL